MGVLAWLGRIVSGIQPVFDFLLALWGSFPVAFKAVSAVLFAVAIGLVMIRNLIL